MASPVSVQVVPLRPCASVPFVETQRELEIALQKGAARVRLPQAFVSPVFRNQMRDLLRAHCHDCLGACRCGGKFRREVSGDLVTRMFLDEAEQEVFEARYGGLRVPRTAEGRVLPPHRVLDFLACGQHDGATLELLQRAQLPFLEFQPTARGQGSVSTRLFALLRAWKDGELEVSVRLQRCVWNHLGSVERLQEPPDGAPALEESASEEEEPAKRRRRDARGGQPVVQGLRHFGRGRRHVCSGLGAVHTSRHAALLGEEAPVAVISATMALTLCVITDDFDEEELLRRADLGPEAGGLHQVYVDGGAGLRLVYAGAGGREQLRRAVLEAARGAEPWTRHVRALGRPAQSGDVVQLVRHPVTKSMLALRLMVDSTSVDFTLESSGFYCPWIEGDYDGDRVKALLAETSSKGRLFLSRLDVAQLMYSAKGETALRLSGVAPRVAQLALRGGELPQPFVPSGRLRLYGGAEEPRVRREEALDALEGFPLLRLDLVRPARFFDADFSVRLADGSWLRPSAPGRGAARRRFAWAIGPRGLLPVERSAPPEPQLREQLRRGRELLGDLLPLRVEVRVHELRESELDGLTVRELVGLALTCTAVQPPGRVRVLTLPGVVRGVPPLYERGAQPPAARPEAWARFAAALLRPPRLNCPDVQELAELYGFHFGPRTHVAVLNNLEQLFQNLSELFLPEVTLRQLLPHDEGSARRALAGLAALEERATAQLRDACDDYEAARKQLLGVVKEAARALAVGQLRGADLRRAADLLALPDWSLPQDAVRAELPDGRALLLGAEGPGVYRGDGAELRAVAAAGLWREPPRWTLRLPGCAPPRRLFVAAAELPRGEAEGVRLTPGPSSRLREELQRLLAAKPKLFACRSPQLSSGRLLAAASAAHRNENAAAVALAPVAGSAQGPRPHVGAAPGAPSLSPDIMAADYGAPWRAVLEHQSIAANRHGKLGVSQTAQPRKKAAECVNTLARGADGRLRGPAVRDFVCRRLLPDGGPCAERCTAEGCPGCGAPEPRACGKLVLATPGLLALAPRWRGRLGRADAAPALALRGGRLFSAREVVEGGWEREPGRTELPPGCLPLRDDTLAAAFACDLFVPEDGALRCRGRPEVLAAAPPWELPEDCCVLVRRGAPPRRTEPRPNREPWDVAEARAQGGVQGKGSRRGHSGAAAAPARRADGAGAAERRCRGAGRAPRGGAAAGRRGRGGGGPEAAGGRRRLRPGPGGGPAGAARARAAGVARGGHGGPDRPRARRGAAVVRAAALRLRPGAQLPGEPAGAAPGAAGVRRAAGPVPLRRAGAGRRAAPGLRPAAADGPVLGLRRAAGRRARRGRRGRRGPARDGEPPRLRRRRLPLPAPLSAGLRPPRGAAEPPGRAGAAGAARPRGGRAAPAAGLERSAAGREADRLEHAAAPPLRGRPAARADDAGRAHRLPGLAVRAGVPPRQARLPRHGALGAAGSHRERSRPGVFLNELKRSTCMPVVACSSVSLLTCMMRSSHDRTRQE